MREADIRDRLAAFGARGDDDFPIAEAALWLARRDLPGNEVEPYLAHLHRLNEGVGAIAGGAEQLRGRVAALRETMFRTHRFVGDSDSYDDPQNANLMRVIDRRKGLPVALGIIAIQAARAQGWEVTGVNFPGHFLIRLSMAGESVMVDPFSRLRRLAAEDLKNLAARVHGGSAPLRFEYIQSVSDREVLLRLLNNIKSRALASGDLLRAYDALDSMVLISPSRAGLSDELATLRTRLKGKLN